MRHQFPDLQTGKGECRHRGSGQPFRNGAEERFVGPAMLERSGPERGAGSRACAIGSMAARALSTEELGPGLFMFAAGVWVDYGCAAVLSQHGPHEYSDGGDCLRAHGSKFIAN